MTFVQFLAQALATLMTLGAAVLAGIQLLRPFVKNAKLATGMDVAERLVSAAVANAEQLIVKPKKDPTQPGMWNAEEAAKTKQGVIDDVAKTAPDVVENLRNAGIAWPREWLGQLVEKEVLKRKTAGGTTVVVPVLSIPPPSAVAERSEP